MRTLPVWNTAWRGIIFPFIYFMPLAQRLGLTVLFFSSVLLVQLHFLPLMLREGTLSLNALPFANVVLALSLMVLSLNFLVGPIQILMNKPEGRQLFGFGKTELLFLGFFLLFALGFLCIFGPVLIAFVGLFALFSEGQGIVNVVAFASIPVLIGFTVWALIRLYPVFGIIVEEKRLGLTQAWQMSKGAWWRVFGVVFSVTLFYWLLALPFHIAMTQELYPKASQIMAANGPEVMRVIALAELQLSLWPFLAVQWIISVFSMAAHGGVVGYVYNALKEQDAAPSAA